MVQIDRMLLGDIGGNPVKIAAEILRQNPGISLPIPLEEIAKAAGIVSIEYRELDGCEGMLVTDENKREGIVAVRKQPLEGRMRFTLGHEIGHFLNPWHKKPGGEFRCSGDDMKKSEDKRQSDDYRMESEANIFAAEILIPRQEFVKDLRRRKGAEIDHIVTLSERYKTSKEMMARRYVDFQDDACAIVFSRNGKIIYVYKQQYFPGLCVWSNDSVPTSSLTAQYKGDEGASSNWAEHPADMWLSSTRYKTVQEQVLMQQEGFRMTLLALGEEKDEEEENLTRSWRPRL
jgi:Zn-dependent peptidase ImmA (M78 family)